LILKFKLYEMLWAMIKYFGFNKRKQSVMRKYIIEKDMGTYWESAVALTYETE